MAMNVFTGHMLLVIGMPLPRTSNEPGLGRFLPPVGKDLLSQVEL